MNRSVVVSVIGAACAVCAVTLLCSPAAYAQESEEMHCDIFPSAVTRPVCTAVPSKSKTPTISDFIFSEMKAAQDAQKAQNWTLEVQKLKAAQASHRKRTPYDDFLINSWLGVADANLKDFADAAPALEAASRSQYAAVAQQKAMLSTVVGMYSQLQQYPQAIAAGQYAMKLGVADPDLYVTVAVDQNDVGQYAQAAATIQQLIDKEPKPEEKYLTFQLDAYTQANDQPDSSKVLGELVTYYPKPNYWLNALQPLMKLNVQDAHLQLDVYRFMNDVGVLQNANDYARMAELSNAAGYPGETVAVLQKAFATNVFTDPRDIRRYQQMLTTAMQKATDDEASLSAQEAKAGTAATGDSLVAIGAAYLSYGQADKAANAISQGISKGGLKYAEEANLLLGVAQLKSHNAAAAGDTFDKVGKSNDAAYAQLGKLWALRSKSLVAT